jgi:hypothetical protein
MSTSYDLIGDLHGHASALEALLRKLGYVDTRGAWRHPTRTAIFLGDFIDRGPRQVGTVTLVRAMVREGSAQAVMGNHELNAIAWATSDERGGFLRRHDDKNRHQHQQFLSQVGEESAQHREFIDWFLTLPLWLDLPGLRVVHACWHPAAMAHLAPQLAEGNRLTRALMPAASTEPDDPAEKDTPQMTVFKAVEALTKGLEVSLPPGHSFQDTDGHTRTRVRVRWWEPTATTFRTAAVDAAFAAQLPELPTPAHTRMTDTHTRPVIFGHYWFTGTPAPLNDLAACVDYSVAKKGQLVAYRFDGEPRLEASRFVTAAP